MISFEKMQELRDSIREVVSEFNEASYGKYSSYAYSAGYLESVLVRSMLGMSKKNREAILSDIKRQTKTLQEQ